MVEIEDLTLYKRQLQRGRVCVLTKNQETISSTTTLLVEGHPYKIRVFKDLVDGVDYGLRFAKDRFLTESESEDNSERDLQLRTDTSHVPVQAR